MRYFKLKTRAEPRKYAEIYLSKCKNLGLVCSPNTLVSISAGLINEYVYGDVCELCNEDDLDPHKDWIPFIDKNFID